VAARFRTSLKKDGAWFAHDPADTFRGNVHTMMVALAKEGAADVRGELASGDGNRAPIRRLGDHVSDHIKGELRRDPAGPGFSAWVFVENRGLNRQDAVSLMAAASFLEGSVRAFKRTAGRISRSRAANAEELLKGLQ
jgi:hypothetical protein